MSDKADNVIEQLTKFGINKEEALVYITLLQSQQMTALALSRELKIARTKIYRLLEKLTEAGLVTEEVKDYGTKFRAAPYETLNIFITDKEHELQTLKENAPNLFNQLALLQTQSTEKSKILFYRGVEGLKQVTWNSTKVKGDFRIYEIDLLHSVVDTEFAEKCRREFAKNKSTFFQLTNATSFSDHTKVTEHIKQWNVRHIPKEELNITFEIQIYNDVTAMFEYTDKDIFIVEIHNQKLAQVQKQIYDLVFRQAVPMIKTSEFGAAELDN